MKSVTGSTALKNLSHIQGHEGAEEPCDPPASEALKSSIPLAGNRRATRTSAAFKGLLWAEWFAHSQLLLVFLAVWLAGVWVLPLFTHAGWILLLGIVYALLAGPVYGGGDVLEGCEEFSFALPATRSERYFARLGVGLGTFCFLTAIDMLALGLDLPHILARLYIDTGILKPMPVLNMDLLYGLVAALPFAAFAFSFAIASSAHSRLLVLTSWFWATLLALILLQCGFWYEEFLFETITGYFACPLLLAGGIAGLGLGHYLYTRKEVAQPSLPLILPARWWLWIILFLAGLSLALFLLSSLAKRYPTFFQS